MAKKLEGPVETRFKNCAEFALLLGSAARGAASTHSDVDVAVKLSEGCDPLAFHIEFSVSVAEALGVDDVDVLL